MHPYRRLDTSGLPIRAISRCLSSVSKNRQFLPALMFRSSECNTATNHASRYFCEVSKRNSGCQCCGSKRAKTRVKWHLLRCCIFNPPSGSGYGRNRGKLMSVTQIMAEVEAAGVSLRLDGEGVRIWFPEVRLRDELASQIAFLRRHRSEVTESMQARVGIPRMPPGVRLVKWNLKEPPVAIESCAVVTEPGLFARTTIEQLRIVLANPKHWVGWSVVQLIERLGQVGVTVDLETNHSRESPEFES